jgi:hypothetical protein
MKFRIFFSIKITQILLVCFIGDSVASKKSEITLKGGCLLSIKSEVNELLASNSLPMP